MDRSHYKDTCITGLDLLGAYTDEFTLESLSMRGKTVDLLAERLTSGERLYRDLRGADVVGLQILLNEGLA